MLALAVNSDRISGATGVGCQEANLSWLVSLSWVEVGHELDVFAYRQLDSLHCVSPFARIKIAQITLFVNLSRIHSDKPLRRRVASAARFHITYELLTNNGE